MMIHEITQKVGRHKPRKRIGRGEGSGIGKTSGRGHKGAKSRSGYKRRPYFEGGQMSIARRMPKRGFTNAEFRNLYHIVNLKTLEARVDDGAEVNVELLASLGIVRDTTLPLKVLGEGDLSKKLVVTAAKFSASAKSKIEAAGGTVQEKAPVKWTRAKAGPSAKRAAKLERKKKGPKQKKEAKTSGS